jgi:N-acetylneuraminate synthase/sialic acid synthase
MLGARVFEKHVTLNRAWPGTDHSFALEPDGFRKFCRDIKRVRHMMPPKSDEDLGNEFVFQKLGKSLVAAIDINPGDEITIDMLSGKIFNDHHIPVRDSNKIIGKIANTEILSGQPIDIDHLN